MDKRESRLERTFRELVALHGAASDEGEVGAYIREQVQGSVDECYVDTFGNLFATRRGPSSMPSLMLVAHMDEIGMMVTRIEENGFLRFEKLGFPVETLLPARKVLVGKAVGVIGSKEFHVMTEEEAKTVKPPRELFIDVGASSIAEVKEMGIKVGTPVTFVSEYVELGMGGKLVCTKSVDDRAGCAALIEMLRELEGTEVPGTVYGVFSAQEEVGLRGARVAAYRLNPTFAVAVDNALTADTPFYPSPTEDTVVLGGGPVIALREDIVSAVKGMVAHPVVLKYLVDCAERAGIKYQHGMLIPWGATDATAIYDVREGIPSCYVGVPSRYAHSPVEVMDPRDLRSTCDLLKEAATGVTADMDFRPY